MKLEDTVPIPTPNIKVQYKVCVLVQPQSCPNPRSLISILFGLWPFYSQLTTPLTGYMCSWAVSSSIKDNVTEPSDLCGKPSGVPTPTLGTTSLNIYASGGSLYLVTLYTLSGPRPPSCIDLFQNKSASALLWHVNIKAAIQECI